MTSQAESPNLTSPFRVPAEVETPALVVDLERFEANLDKMSAICRESGVESFPTPRPTGRSSWRRRSWPTAPMA